MKTKILLTLLMFFGILLGCEPIPNNDPNNENNQTDSVPTQTDSIPTQTDTVPAPVDPNLSKALKLDSSFVRKRAGTAYCKAIEKRGKGGNRKRLLNYAQLDSTSNIEFI